MGKFNEILEQKFNEMSLEKKMTVLGVNDDTFSVTRFRGIEKDVVVNDIWNGKTNAEKRSLMKGF